MKRERQGTWLYRQLSDCEFLKIVITLFLILGMAGATSAATLYVGADLESSGDGTSWATAYASLGEALTDAEDGDEIWMQGGTYSIGPSALYLSGVIYGGFNGTETLLSQRDLGANETILDGSAIMYSSSIVNIITNATVDGLTFTNHSGASAAMAISNSPTIRNCNFFYNTTTSGEGYSSTNAYYGGAAIKIGTGSPVITNCVFAHNSAPYGYGGAVNMYNSSADFINCTFTRNTAIDGGAAGIYDGSSNEFYNCIFWGNTMASMDIKTGPGATYTASYNYYEAYDGDPLLVDPDNGNYHLSPGSPCIDAGTSSVTLASVDMDGDAREIDGDENGSTVVDIGADEFDPTQEYYADIYVDATQSDDTGDGTTWATAKATLRGAIDAAEVGDQIWVRTGTYASIVVDKAVSIYGGFVGTEIQRISRDPDTYPTVIDGQDSTRCVYVTAAAVLDSFSITNGSSTAGGGVLISNSGATIANCIIDSNASSGFGGGVYFSSAAIIENCDITNNQASSGGGIYNSFVSSTITSCLIENNSATGSGGGIFNDGGMAPKITSCTIRNNYASANGGGIFNDEKNDAVISGCTIVLNTASTRGGGIYSGQDSSSNTTYAAPEITNNIIANNWATWGGGLYCAAYSTPEIINCTIAGNTAATAGAGVYVVDAASYTRIMNSVLYGNVLDAGGYSDIYFNGSTETNLTLLFNNFSMLDESWHNSGASRTGNIGVPAGFGDYDGTDGDPLTGGDSNYHISESSGLVDQGVTSCTVLSVTLVAPEDDLDGNARPQGNDVDLGAYESSYTASIVQYDLTASVFGGNGTVSPTSGTYDNNEAVTLTAAPVSGYQVASWSGTSNDSSTSTTNTVVMDSDKTVTVTFETIPVTQYTLTASVSGGNGTVSPTSGTYDDGETVTLTATPASGYQVASWSGTSDDSATTTTNTVVMDSAKTVTVTFEAIPVTQYTLTASVSGGNGSVDPTSGTYGNGTTVTLTATPDTGYQVASWNGTSDDSVTTTSNTVVMDGDKTVTVTLEAIPVTQYTLTVQVEGQGSVTPLDGEYDSGTVVTLTATPESQWVFDGWSGNVADTDASSTTIVMDADQSITATFLADADDDSVPDETEYGPDGDDPTYDGNGDGTPDSAQDFVLSGPTYGGDQYVTIVFPETAVIDELSVIETPPDAPDDVIFTWDCFRFALDGLVSGSAIQVEIFLPEDAAPVSYYKYGPTSDDGTSHWYEFIYDGTTGAEIDGNVITLHLVDGQRGDDDLTENGSILDDGGPVVAADDSDAATGGGGSSGCFIATAGASESFQRWRPGAAFLGTLLLFVAGLGKIQRD